MRPCGLVLFLCALGAFAAAVAVGADDLATLVRNLGSEDHDPRYQAYLELNRRKDPAVLPLLVEALPNMPDQGQYYGVLHMQQYPPKTSRGPLRRLTTAAGPYLRVMAAAALWRQGETDAAKIISKALRQPDLDAEARTALLTRVYGIRDDGVMRAVREMVVPAADVDLLGQALYVLHQLQDHAALPAARGLVKGERPGVRALGAAFLLARGEVGGVDVLAAALRTGEVERSAVYKVRTLLRNVRPPPVAVLEALVDLLDEADGTDVYIVRTAAEMLGEHGYAKAAPVLRTLLDHRSTIVSKAAFEALARLPGGFDPESMRALLDGGSDERRLAAADALRRADDLSGLDVVIGILRASERSTDRAEAARVLGGFRTAKAVEPLLDALLDEQSTVRANAYNSLGYVLRSLFPYRRLDLGSTGYVTSAAVHVRQKAVARLRAWWEKNRTRDW